MKPSRVTTARHHFRAEEVWELGNVAGECLHCFGLVHGIAYMCQVVRQEGVVVGATVCLLPALKSGLWKLGWHPEPERS